MIKESDRAVILVVDDEPYNISFLEAVLDVDYDVLTAADGEKALKLAVRSSPDLVLLDLMMPDMDGYEVCSRLKSNPLTRNIPVIFVTTIGSKENEAKGFELGAVDYILKPISIPILQARVKTHLALSNQTRTLEKMVHERTRELIDTRMEIIRRLGRAAEYKDNETGMHIIRMSHYSRLIGLAAGMDEAEAELLFDASPMHDIGKIGTPDCILKKPAGLDKEEWDQMKLHPAIGMEIIGDHSSELLQSAKIIAYTHHEKWDGSGYPQGLIGENIPLLGRIVAIADVFDALTSRRPYKKAWPIGKAVDLVRQESGQHFDPHLVDLFITILPQVVQIHDKYAEP